MRSATHGAVWYLVSRSTVRRRRGLLAITLLVALVGGVALAALAAARRTQAAYPAYLAASHASALQVNVYSLYSPYGVARPISRQLGTLHGVVHVAASPTVFLFPKEPKGVADATPIADGDVQFLGSLGGAYFEHDRPAVVAGRMANPANPHEIVASPSAASLLGWHVGQHIEFDAYTLQQATLSIARPTHVYARVAATLVGLVVFANQVAHDDVDRYPTYVLTTPALLARYPATGGYSNYELSVAGGAAGVSAVEREVVRLLPVDTVYTFHVTSVVEGEVERAIKPESIALAVFGAIAAAAMLLIGGQAIRRELWARRGDLDVARALGASPSTLVAAGAVGPAGASLVGASLAIAVAVALSPLSPLGPVRSVDPSPGVALDWVVLAGAVVFAALLVGLAVLFAATARRPLSSDGRDHTPRRSRLVVALSRTGLPAPAAAGIGFSLESSSGRSAAAVRSALAAAVIAVVVIVTTVTFASGLTTLDTHPALYGWNWDYAIVGPNGSSVPPTAGRLLARDHDVAAWTGLNYANAQFGRTSRNAATVPILIAQPHAELGPPLLSGHEVEQPNQVVLGAGTAAQLHVGIGQTLVASYGYPSDYPVYVPPTRLHVVGIATMPAIGSPDTLHTSMSVGAVLSQLVEPPAFRAALKPPDVNQDGPSMYVVRLRPGVSAAIGLASIKHVAAVATAVMRADPRSGDPPPFIVVGAQRPAEIVIYQSSGATPAVLALALAAGAVVALALALTTSVRRRRRDLAMLKTLGFTRRQLAGTIASQSTVVAVVGVLFGVPIGIALGRWLWILFARQIGAVSDATVPVLQVAAIAVGALVLANLVAAVPGRVAARTPAGLVLRSE
jgi:FtsX-like permease family